MSHLGFSGDWLRKAKSPVYASAMASGGDFFSPWIRFANGSMSNPNKTWGSQWRTRIEPGYERHAEIFLDATDAAAGEYQMRVDEFTRILEAAGCRPRRVGSRIVAFCPSHELDGRIHTPSLSVTERDGQARFHCFGGCDPRSVLTSLGLTWAQFVGDERRRFRCSAKKLYLNNNPPRDFESFVRKFRATPAQLVDFSVQVPGTVPDAWYRLRVGQYRGAIAAPMFDSDGRIIGIRLRWPNGEKRSIRGSQGGLFLPHGLIPQKPLAICEGLTDTAACLSLGIDAVGIPSATAGKELAIDAVKQLRPVRVVLVADNDQPGRESVSALAHELWLFTSVRILVPWEKDLRAAASTDPAATRKKVMEAFYAD